MENSLAKIIVKVGKQSNVKLSNCKAFRAIVAEDLERLANKYTDCNIVIIESIIEEENDAVKNFVKSFVDRDENNSVLFFIANENDEVTSGLADELDYNIYFTFKEICNFIKSKYGINVGASLEDKKDNNYEEIDIPDLFDVANIEQASENNVDSISNEIEQIEEATAEEFDTLNKAMQEEIEKSAAPYEEKSLEDDLFEMPEFNSVENTNEEENKPEVNIKKEEVKPIEQTKQIEEVVQTSSVNSDELEKYKEQVQEEIEKLQTKLRDTKYEYNTLLKDIKGANTRIVQLEQMVEVLKAEKQDITVRFEELMADNTVIEDPISLSEYSKLQDIIEEKDSSISKLEQTISDLREQLETCKSDVELKDVEIGNLNGTIDGLKKSIASGEVNKEETEHYKEEVERYKKSADALRVEKDKISDKLTSIGELNQEIQTDNEKLKHKLSLEIDYRKETISLVQSAFEKVVSISKSFEEAQKTIKKLQQEVSKSNSIAEELRKQNDILNADTVKLKDTITKKDESIEKLEGAMKNSDSFLDEKLNELENVTKAKEDLEQALNSSNEQVSALKTQLNTLEAQLKQSEDQNSLLISQKSTAENSVQETNNNMVELNKQLSKSNKSLMEQLSVVTKELNSRKQTQERLEAEVEQYKNQVGTTNNVIYNNNSATDENILPIRYSGMAQILSVCSSGSFGATTLAMSIITRISPTSRVLYIDFDMVSPNADAWFSKSPFCQGIPNINKDVKASALGIFYEKGLKTFETHMDKIIIPIEKTKGGCVDYLSGLYYRVDKQKIINADYTGLFNLIGSQYEYIIVDLGRLGNSELNDMIIQIISEITFKNIVVTTPDRFEVRNFNMKLRANNMDLQKIVWLLNMCISNQIDQPVQKVLASFKFGQMFEDPALRGTRDKFTRDRQNRDRLDTFINSALFSR